MTPEELLNHATEFAFRPAGLRSDSQNARYYTVEVSRRAEGRYAVTHMGQCWDGEDWVYESLPSSRTDEFKGKARFPLQTAVEIAQKAVHTVTINGFTYAEFAKRYPELH